MPALYQDHRGYSACVDRIGQVWLLEGEQSEYPAYMYALTFN